MSKAITLVYDPICPFAQRAWITLLEKQVPFEKMKVDIYNKSEEFKKVYSKAYGRNPDNVGMVPVLVYGDLTIAESDLISEFIIDEFKTGSELIPRDNFDKVRMRRFINSVVPKLISNFYGFFQFNKKNEEEQKKIKENLDAALREIDKEIEGPYAIGKEFTLADIMIYPWLERTPILKHLGGYEIP